MHRGGAQLSAEMLFGQPPYQLAEQGLRRDPFIRGLRRVVMVASVQTGPGALAIAFASRLPAVVSYDTAQNSLSHGVLQDDASGPR